MRFEILGEIRNIEIIATGHGVRSQNSLKRRFGGFRWRKMKGIARILTSSGEIRSAELHWYEAHGIGKKFLKKKRYLD
jgi:hypothetical protein